MNVVRPLHSVHPLSLLSIRSGVVFSSVVPARVGQALFVAHQLSRSRRPTRHYCVIGNYFDIHNIDIGQEV